MEKKYWRHWLYTFFVVTVAIMILFVSEYSAIKSVNNEVVRAINPDAIGNLSFEEKTEQLLGGFDEISYGATTDNKSVYFEGISTLSIDEIHALNFVTSYEEEVIQKYETVIDPYSLEYKIKISYIQNNEIIRVIEESINPYFVEEANDYVFEYNGQIVSIRDTLQVENLNNCVALVDDAAVAIAVGTVVVVVACAPIIEKMVTQVVETVVSVVKSFWSWLTTVFTSTVTTTVVTTDTKYNVKVFNRDFTLEKVKDNKRIFVLGQFHLAIVVKSNVFISQQTISLPEAISILASGTILNIGGANTLLNTYTLTYNDAKKASDSAIVAQGKMGESLWHNYHQYDNTGKKKIGVFYQHFHPVVGKDSNNAPHSFYGSALINT